MIRIWTVALSAELVVAGCGLSGKCLYDLPWPDHRRRSKTPNGRSRGPRGFTLRVEKGSSMIESDWQVLAPHEPFMVFVLRSPALAESRFEPYSRHVLRAFNLLRHNVFVVSAPSEGSTLELTAEQRARIAAAMNSLGQ